MIVSIDGSDVKKTETENWKNIKVAMRLLFRSLETTPHDKLTLWQCCVIFLGHFWESNCSATSLPSGQTSYFFVDNVWILGPQKVTYEI